jgi:hypothetical protein
MAHHIYPQALAFFEETTPCVAPADWSAETAIEFISIDLSGVKEALVADPTAERRAFKVGTRHMVKGIRNCTASIVLKLHGIGEETADGDQVENTYLARILKHCLGGLHRGSSTTITGGTATIPEVDDATGIIPGCLLAFEDTTSPSARNAGIAHPRRVLSVSGSAVTLSEAIPFTPAAGDVVHAVATGYLDHDHLVDAVAAGGLCQWYVKRENSNSGTDLLWTLEGSVASLKLDGLGRGALPTLNLDIQAANFRHGAEDGLTNVALAAPEGHAQLAMGLNVILSIQEYGTSTVNEVDANNVTFDVGMTRKPTPTTTERLHRFEGLSSYHYDPGQSKFTCTLVGYTDDFYAGLADNKDYRISFYQPGDGSGAGKGWVLHCGRARLMATPARTDVEQVHGVTLEFMLAEPEDCSGGSNADLEQSRFLLGLF